MPISRFALRDQDGRSDGPARHRGSPAIVTFLYSTCEDTCPAQAQEIRAALDELGRDLPVFAVSVDPANDTPRRARRFLVEQGLTGRMAFLLGDEAALAPVWREYAIAPQREGREHSAYVVLLDGRAGSASASRRRSSRVRRWCTTCAGWARSPGVAARAPRPVARPSSATAC
jgi:protein SCO1/2